MALGGWKRAKNHHHSSKETCKGPEGRRSFFPSLLLSPFSRLGLCENRRRIGAGSKVKARVKDC